MVLKGVLEPDAGPLQPRAPIRTTHRRIDGHEVYFVINDSPRPWEGKVRFSAEDQDQPERWDPASGKSVPLGRGNPVTLSFDPYGATLLRFGSSQRPARHRLSTGALPNLVVKPLPRVEPVVHHGEDKSPVRVRARWTSSPGPGARRDGD